MLTAYHTEQIVHSLKKKNGVPSFWPSRVTPLSQKKRYKFSCASAAAETISTNVGRKDAACHCKSNFHHPIWRPAWTNASSDCCFACVPAVPGLRHACNSRVALHRRRAKNEVMTKRCSILFAPALTWPQSVAFW